MSAEDAKQVDDHWRQGFILRSRIWTRFDSPLHLYGILGVNLQDSQVRVA